MLRAQASGYDGIVPGPVLQVRRGDELRLRLVNDLPEPTTLQCHGLRLPNAMDGVPTLTQAPVAPGESFDYRFIAPDAGTYWYHAPGPARSGLYGILVVTETEAVDVDRDVTLIFDQSAPADGVTAPANAAPFTVNGSASFDIRARSNDRLRLRLLNACAGQILALRVTGLRCFVMAIDGEPAEPFAARDGRLVLGPGNRIDVFVDCTLGPGAAAAIVVENAPAASPIARILCDTGAPGPAMPRVDPPPLPPNPLPERMDFPDAYRLDTAVVRAAATRPAGVPLFTVKRGRAVVLGLSNSTSENCFIHLHGHHFRLLDTLDDGWKPFWLDTMPVAAQTACRIAFVADNPGKWLIEGLANANGAAGWFEVT